MSHVRCHFSSVQRSRDKSPPTRAQTRQARLWLGRGFEPHPYFLLGAEKTREKSTMKLQLYVILLTAFAAFGGLMFGYDIG